MGGGAGGVTPASTLAASASLASTGGSSLASSGAAGGVLGGPGGGAGAGGASTQGLVRTTTKLAKALHELVKGAPAPLAALRSAISAALRDMFRGALIEARVAAVCRSVCGGVTVCVPSWW